MPSVSTPMAHMNAVAYQATKEMDLIASVSLHFPSIDAKGWAVILQNIC